MRWSWFRDILDGIIWTHNLFYYLYETVYGWVWPFWEAAEYFYFLSELFADLSWYFTDFAYWIDDVSDKIASFLDYDAVYAYFYTYFQAAIDSWAWVEYAWSNVYAILEGWWASTQVTVQTWIDEAKHYYAATIVTIQNDLHALTQDWLDWAGVIPLFWDTWTWVGNAWENIMPNLESWWNSTIPSVSDLITSSLTEWFPFYDELAALWSSIREFFVDPEDWLYKSLDRIIERFW